MVTVKVNVAEIAQKASVSQASIYNFFTSKKELLNELMKNLLDNHYRGLIDIIDSGAPFRQRLEKLIRAKIEFLNSFSIHLMLESIEMDVISSEMALHEIYQSYMGKFMCLFDEGKRAGILDPTVTNDTIAVFLDMIQHYVLSNTTVSRRLEDPQFMDEFFTMIRNAFFSSSIGISGDDTVQGE